MIYFIDVDSTIPNIVEMRLATYFRGLGEEFRLVSHRSDPPFQRTLWDPPGRVFASSIFEFSREARDRVEQEWGIWGPITWGGTGVRLESNLSEIDPSIDWESVPLDYTDYPDERRSIGFTQRGCRLKCGHCVVPKKEGRPKSVHTIGDIYRGGKHKPWFLLLDNDFFGQPREEWIARIDELLAIKRSRVCFSQGINIRLVDEEVASYLARVEYRDNEFQERVLYTAWDNIGHERIFKRGVEELRKAGVPPKHLRVYMLIGYAAGETMEQIQYRFDEMVALGCEPFPMVYDHGGGPPKLLKDFQRWATTGLYRAFPFSEYDVSIKRKRLPVVS